MSYELEEFPLPFVNSNPNGWGPTGIPETFKTLPYQPFSKSDQLGRVADWTGTVYTSKNSANKYATQFQPGSQYAYHHDEEESEFQLVDSSKPVRPTYARSRVRVNAGRGWGNRGAWSGRAQLQQQQQQQQLAVKQLAANRGAMTKQQVFQERQRLRYMNRIIKQSALKMQEGRNRMQHKNREAAVKIKETWKVLDDLEFSRFSRLHLSVGMGETLAECGWVGYYDRYADRITPRSSQAIRRCDREDASQNVHFDHKIRSFAFNKAGNVFLTDSVLSCLMCCTRSVYSWAIWIDKVGGTLLLETKRDDNRSMENPSVNENATDPPPHRKDAKEPNANKTGTAEYLQSEAVYIYNSFSHHVLTHDGPDRIRPYHFKEKSPFSDNLNRNTSLAFRYRRWDLGNGIRVVVRCRVNAVEQMGGSNSAELVALRSLFLYDQRGTDWRSRADKQPGNVLAIALKNNNFNMARWAVEAMLAGCRQLKLGYVCRSPEHKSHTLLSVQPFDPENLASQINLNINQCWGIVRALVDTLNDKPDGK